MGADRIESSQFPTRQIAIDGKTAQRSHHRWAGKAVTVTYTMTTVSEKSSGMSTLIVIAYPEELRATEVLATLKQLRSEDLIDLDEAFYMTKVQEGDTKVHHPDHPIKGS